MRSVHGSVTMAFLLCLFASGAAGQDSSEPPWEKLEKVATRFVEDVSSGRAEKAWELFGAQPRRQLPRRQAAAAFSAFHGPLGTLESIDRESTARLAEGCGRLIYLARYEYADMRFTFELCPDEEEWKIDLFGSESVKVARTEVVRRAIYAHLAKSSIPEPKGLNCPGIEETVDGSTSPCRVDLGERCVLTLILMFKDEGFAVVDGTASPECPFDLE